MLIIKQVSQRHGILSYGTKVGEYFIFWLKAFSKIFRFWSLRIKCAGVQQKIFEFSKKICEKNEAEVFLFSAPADVRVPKVSRHSLDDGVTDTVGVVVMDPLGNVASTVSSGGIALKQPGRVGQV